jgi:hypothetical protein
MKTNKILLVIILVASFGSNLFSQLNVFNNGYVGINGAVPNGYPLGVRSAYGEIISIDPLTGASNIGASTDIINFWYSSSTGFNRLYAQSYSTASDSTIKKNIESLSPGALYKVLSLRPVSFEYKNEFNSVNDAKLKKIGLIAQEVEAIIPEAVSFSEVGNAKMIDYDMFIPVLIKAIQEQQSTIESLQAEIINLKSGTVNLKSATISTDVKQNVISDISTLEQNAPNPYSQTTEIKYYLPEASRATLFIYNMNGLQIKSIQITQMGKGSVTINGSELSPGMYLYTLIADGKEVATKHMILTE